MESPEMEKAMKKAAKHGSEVTKKKKKTKNENKSNEASAVEGKVKNAATVEEKNQETQKNQVNKEDKPAAATEKKEKKEKKSKDTTTLSAQLPAQKDSKVKKRKRDTTTDDSSKTKKKSKKTPSQTLPEELEIDISAPNPPSKKALRLQKKGKPIPKLPSTSRPPTELTPATTNPDAIHPDRQKLVKEIPHAEWSVWIGNLSYKSDVKGLRGWLVRGDKRVTDKDITRINLPLNADGQSKGFAYVDLQTQEAMETVISRSEENFDGRNLLIKNGRSFEGRPAERKQRYQVKSLSSAGGRMEVNAGETVSGKEGVVQESVKEEGLEKKRKRTGEEKVKKVKKAKEV